jgi:predicted transcriptional regulator of viral defense system
LKLIKAITLSLGELNTPVITRYQLGLVIYTLYKEKRYAGEAIALKKPTAEGPDFTICLRQLEEEGVLHSPRHLPGSVYSLLGRKDWPADEVACVIDPFCYVSHLSAMAYHGLTNRIPTTLYLSSPSPQAWKQFAHDMMATDLGEDLQTYLDNGMPGLVRTAFKRIGRTDVHCFTSKHRGAYKNVRGKHLRVSTIGRTFLDMLRNPDLCGGIRHVLEVYEAWAEKYLRLITDEITQHGAPIDKVRAGYILEERLALSNEVIGSWAQYAQRGGSRKLDATAEYLPQWSDKWCLSINTFE